MNDSLKKNQVYKELLGQIRRGVLAPGEQLPGEAQLAVSLHVSRVTLRAALDLLEEEGLVEREPLFQERSEAGIISRSPV